MFLLAIHHLAAEAKEQDALYKRKKCDYGPAERHAKGKDGENQVRRGKRSGDLDFIAYCVSIQYTKKCFDT